MYLELAEGYQPDYLQESENPMEYYIAVPNETGGFNYVREDKFDELPDWAFEQVLDAQPYMSEGDYLQSKASRMARRSRRQAKKQSKGLRKQERHEMRMKGEGGLQRTLSKVGGIATSIFGGGQQAAPPTQEKGFEVTAQASDATTGFLKSPVVLIGGLLLVGGIAFAIASRNKKK